MPSIENILCGSMALDHGICHSGSSNVISRHHVVRTSITGEVRYTREQSILICDKKQGEFNQYSHESKDQLKVLYVS